MSNRSGAIVVGAVITAALGIILLLLGLVTLWKMDTARAFSATQPETPEELLGPQREETLDSLYQMYQRADSAHYHCSISTLVLRDPETTEGLPDRFGPWLAELQSACN